MAQTAPNKGFAPPQDQRVGAAGLSSQSVFSISMADAKQLKFKW
jgi:hypothetical protein